jgi:HTH-type transcriptional regulator/antitoxin HigA
MIQNDIQYDAIMERIDELLKIVTDETPPNDKNFIELMLLSDMIAAYEDVHYPIETPDLAEVIKLRMYEMNLTQAKLAELIGVSAPRISEYLSGKSEPTFQVAKSLHKKLNISSNIILS